MTEARTFLGAFWCSMSNHSSAATLVSSLSLRNWSVSSLTVWPYANRAASGS